MSLAAFFKFTYVLYCIFVWRCIHKLNCFIYIVSQIISIYMKEGVVCVCCFVLVLCCLYGVYITSMLLLYSCICLVRMHFIMVYCVCVCVYDLYLMCVCACLVLLFFLSNKLELRWLYLAHTIKNDNHSKEQRKMINKMYSM